MLIIPICVKHWLIWMSRNLNKKLLNLILSFGFSKGLLNWTIVVLKVVNFAKD
jgi:hypothetical protein